MDDKVNVKKINFDVQKGIILVVAVSLSFVFYGMYIYPHYATDTYKIINTTDFTPQIIWDEHSLPFIKWGRYTLGIMMYLVSLLRINPLSNNFFTNTLSILFFGVSLFQVVVKIYEKYSYAYLSKVGIFLGVAPIFLNPLYTDWMQFPECILYYSFGLISLTYIVTQISFDEINFKSQIKFFILLLIVFGIYQVLINMFIILSLVFLMMDWFANRNRAKEIRKYVIKAANIFITYLVCSLIQIGILKFLSAGVRMSTDIKSNLITVIKLQPVLWSMTTSGSFNLILLFSVLIGLVYLIFKIVKSKSLNNFNIIIVVGGLIAIYGIMMSTHILAEPWLSQRTTVMLYAIPGFLLLISISIHDIPKMNYGIKGLVLAVFICLTIVYSYRSNDIAIGLHKTNSMDKMIVLQIKQMIEQYELDTQIQVNKIAFKNDPYRTWIYPDVFGMFDLNLRAWAVDWARANMFRLYSQRYFEEIPMPDEIYEEYFQDKDWQSFQAEQVEIIGDTVYIMVY